MRVRFFLRLCCLGLVVVVCSSGSFLHPLGLVFFSFLRWPTLPLLCVSPLHLSSLLSLPSALQRFLFFLLFHVCSCLLRFPLYSASVSFAAVALTCGSSEFRFPFLIIIAYYPFASGCFPCILSSFFLAFFPLGASHLRFRRYFCLSILLFAGFSVITSSSPGVGFALVLPSCAFHLSVLSFSPVRLLRLEFWTPYSLVGCSDFSSMSVGLLPWILGSPFSFIVLPCAPFFSSFRFCSPVFFLSFLRFFLPDCVSLHAALLFLLSFRLVRSCFGASLPS